MLHVLYLVHDLADPAVRRRVLMLLTGGATVTLAGFRRDDNPLAGIEGIQPIELGRTRDRRFLQRTLAVLRATFRLRRMVAGLKRQPDVIIARNLEMLTLAERAAGLMARRPPIAYEALDIHRLLLRRDPLGALLRAVERRLGRNARLLITSSPAFLRAYFARFAQISAPVELVENKVLALTEEAPLPVEGSRRAGPPWVIGWFGALRCRRSLALLAAFSRAMGGRFRIVLRGRPAHGEFEDFDGLVAREPFIEFLGPYRNPEDLAAIYRRRALRLDDRFLRGACQFPMAAAQPALRRVCGRCRADCHGRFGERPFAGRARHRPAARGSRGKAAGSAGRRHRRRALPGAGQCGGPARPPRMDLRPRGLLAAGRPAEILALPGARLFCNKLHEARS